MNFVFDFLWPRLTRRYLSNKYFSILVSILEKQCRSTGIHSATVENDLLKVFLWSDDVRVFRWTVWHFLLQRTPTGINHQDTTFQDHQVYYKKNKIKKKDRVGRPAQAGIRYTCQSRLIPWEVWDFTKRTGRWIKGPPRGLGTSHRYLNTAVKQFWRFSPSNWNWLLCTSEFVLDSLPHTPLLPASPPSPKRKKGGRGAGSINCRRNPAWHRRI